MQLARELCRDLDSSLGHEWLEADGLGGYASSTIHLCPTRRYHGLLVSRPPGSNKRHVFLSRFEELVHIDGRAHPISMARYPGTWSPAGNRELERFSLAPYPSSRFQLGDVEVIREIMQVRGKALVLCRYSVRGENVELELRPLLPYREADALTVENDELDDTAEEIDAGIRCRPYAALPPIEITVDGGPHRFVPSPTWYQSIEYARDIERGYPGREDQFCPGSLRVAVDDGGEVVLAATVAERVKTPRALWKKESRRRRAESDQAGVLAGAAASVEARVALSADAFLYEAPNRRVGVNAGFPWFGEWGRDTFISLPGLTLARGQIGMCARGLSGALEYLKDGLLPNIYGNSRDDSHYGSVDASLWFARAVLLYARGGGESERVVDEYLPALVEIAEAYASGTALETGVDEAGLVCTGTPELNPTWMDARTSKGPVTPRDGCPVEINALWYSLLAHLEELHDAKGDSAGKRSWMSRKRLAKRSFLERFWLEDRSYLADCWKDGVVDASVRPNMVIAAALELSPLTRSRRRAVTEVAREHLLTPRGLRTLAPDAPEYAATYRGDPDQRDGAYHQGTVWPWLLGFYCEACMRSGMTKKAERDELAALWDAFEDELDGRGLEHISEVFDAEPPHRSGGTIAQAWNSAELLRSRKMLAQGRP